MKFLTVKNFERFQHYKDRAPLWIKMHTSVLSDFALLSLPEAAQAQLFKLWVLASRMDNRIPNDRKFIAAQIFAKKLYVAELVAAGFLVETNEPATPIRADWASRYIAEDVRARVLARTEGHCAACGSAENIEIDHIVPISRGGTGDDSNLQALCRKCNRKKRTRTGSAETLATQNYADAEPREEIEKRIREIEPSSAAAAEAEAGLAVMLETDADRNALTVVVSRATDRNACLAALRAILTGNDTAVPQPSPRVFGRAMRDLAMNGAPPSARVVRSYVETAAREELDPRPPGGASPRRNGRGLSGVNPGAQQVANILGNGGNPRD